MGVTQCFKVVPMLLIPLFLLVIFTIMMTIELFCDIIPKYERSYIMIISEYTGRGKRDFLTTKRTRETDSNDWNFVKEQIKAANPTFITLENHDGILKSPYTQPGRDFAIILKEIDQMGYNGEWCVIDSDGFYKCIIVLYKNEIDLKTNSVFRYFAPVFISETKTINIRKRELEDIKECFSYQFQNYGKLIDGVIETIQYNAPNEQGFSLLEFRDCKITI